MTSLRSGSATDVGRVRTSNQDVALEDPDLFAVADGMGGHVGGEVAARVAVDSLRGAFQRQPTVEGLRRAVAEANRAVWRQGQTESGLRGMGTTLTATALVQETGGRQVIALANVGDSRAYVFSKGQVIQVTADHSLAEEKVRQGQLTEAEAAVHPHRHILTRALGVSSDVDVDLWELHLHDGDRILLCSDGLTNEIADDRIGDILGQVEEPSEAAKALVKAAVDHGGSDNVTCVVIDVVGAEKLATASAAGAASREGRPATSDAAAVAKEGQASSAGVGAHAEDPAQAKGSARANDSAQIERAGAGENPAGDEEAGASSRPRAGAPTRTLRAVAGTGTGRRVPARSGAKNAPVAVPSNGASAAGVTGSTPQRMTPIQSAIAGGGTPGPGEQGTPPNGKAPREPASLSATRFQAAELRRLHPRDDRRSRRRAAGAPRLITVRLVLFLLLLLGVVAAAYAAIRWYSMDDWYVTVDHGHLAVYQGRPGGFLWFKPQLVDDTPVTTNEVLSYMIPHDRQEPSLAAAKSFVGNLHAEYLATKGLSHGTAPASGAAAHATPSGGFSSTTAAAYAPPVAAWQ